jgi:hypothetical protein
MSHFYKLQGSVKSSIDMDVRLKRPASDAKTASLHIYTQLKQSIELATTEQQVDIIFKKAAIEEERRFAGKKGEIDSLILQHIEAEKYVSV